MKRAVLPFAMALFVASACARFTGEEPVPSSGADASDAIDAGSDVSVAKDAAPLPPQPADAAATIYESAFEATCDWVKNDVNVYESAPGKTGNGCRVCGDDGSVGIEIPLLPPSPGTFRFSLSAKTETPLQNRAYLDIEIVGVGGAPILNRETLALQPSFARYQVTHTAEGIATRLKVALKLGDLVSGQMCVVMDDVTVERIK